ncbi:hypothetical protein TBLA_0C02030 [Henningerozyma blattae CBS 6284]|uniref:Uncharacterized protein n=1 Tax=Henningerozyma blattae (strain ATCC 34711 / CBS 6284 / DSM 70876 / NBRC 10599 / NRRL Y-10934 / UCD 77-7) TaxID=1071380 RepID=I2H0W3_HENB6|nr:hypothetical protein TBLA_0C02030 [Tetrapisispora blattae CBS 6284]CCH60015.1 hypothetical protein TBLA_0C02030 [Tetrapisispora blattae CBS 6284]
MRYTYPWHRCCKRYITFNLVKCKQQHSTRISRINSNTDTNSKSNDISDSQKNKRLQETLRYLAKNSSKSVSFSDLVRGSIKDTSTDNNYQHTNVSNNHIENILSLYNTNTLDGKNNHTRNTQTDHRFDSYYNELLNNLKKIVVPTNTTTSIKSNTNNNAIADHLISYKENVNWNFIRKSILNNKSISMEDFQSYIKLINSKDSHLNKRIITKLSIIFYYGIKDLSIYNDYHENWLFYYPYLEPAFKRLVLRDFLLFNKDNKANLWSLLGSNSRIFLNTSSDYILLYQTFYSFANRLPLPIDPISLTKNQSLFIETLKLASEFQPLNHVLSDISKLSVKYKLHSNVSNGFAIDDYHFISSLKTLLEKNDKHILMTSSPNYLELKSKIVQHYELIKNTVYKKFTSL